MTIKDSAPKQRHWMTASSFTYSKNLQEQRGKGGVSPSQLGAATARVETFTIKIHVSYIGCPRGKKAKKWDSEEGGNVEWRGGDAKKTYRFGQNRRIFT